jgi:hypothetical protein
LGRGSIFGAGMVFNGRMVTWAAGMVRGRIALGEVFGSGIVVEENGS